MIDSKRERELLLLQRGEQIRKLRVQPSDSFEAGQMVERARIMELLDYQSLALGPLKRYSASFQIYELLMAYLKEELND